MYLEGQTPNKDLPEFIVVECPKYSGPQFFQEAHKKNWIPLPPDTFQDDSYSASRTGYALRLAYAMTIHKSQGESLVMVDIGIGKRCDFSIDYRRKNRDSRGDDIRSYVKMPKPQKHMHPAFSLRPSFTPAPTKRHRSAPGRAGSPS